MRTVQTEAEVLEEIRQLKRECFRRKIPWEPVNVVDASLFARSRGEDVLADSLLDRARTMLECDHHGRPSSPTLALACPDCKRSLYLGDAHTEFGAPVEPNQPIEKGVGITHKDIFTRPDRIAVQQFIREITSWPELE